MSEYTYATLVSKAKTVKSNAENEQKKPAAALGYYFAKAILKPKKAVTKITIEGASKSSGDNFSRQISKTNYKSMATRLVEFVEKKKQMPNYITVASMKMRVSDYVLMFANILISYNTNAELPDKINVNSKVYTKPVEYPNEVFKNWVTKFKFTPKYLDDVCDYIIKHFNYQFYYDDHKSNAEVISSKSGNCVDLLQMLCNMAKALGYEFKVIHTECKQSKVGHVYGMFRKVGVNGGNWFIRDIACIADESRYCVWCEVPGAGNKLAENPSWFMANLNR